MYILPVALSSTRTVIILGDSTMWRDAVEEIEPSVAVVLENLSVDLGDDEFELWHVLGTAFCIHNDDHPLFLTNEHVARETHKLNLEVEDAPEAEEIAGEELEGSRKELALVGRPGQGGEALAVGAEIWQVERNLDLAILASSPGGTRFTPAVFSENNLRTGAPVATMGYPLQKQPELEPGGGRLELVRRFVAGWVGSQVPRETDGGGEFPHYEIDIKSYPGISGAPCFGTDGRVTGVMRGSFMHGDAAVFGYAVRNQELLPALRNVGVTPLTNR